MIYETFSHCRIVMQPGAGGMVAVYEPLDAGHFRTAALESIPLESIDDPEAKAGFISETTAGSALDHPGLCALSEDHLVNEATRRQVEAREVHPCFSRRTGRE